MLEAYAQREDIVNFCELKIGSLNVKSEELQSV
jgi:hypothetical protein